MKSFFSKYIDKLYINQWTLGYCRGDIKNVIRTKSFTQEITWLKSSSVDYYSADPFLLKTKNGNYHLFFEYFPSDESYGKISLMTFNNDFELLDQKILLDTKSHLSYPFIFKENDNIYVFPESGDAGSLSCYLYDPLKQSLNFQQEIMKLPLLDSTILKYDNKYWIFGTLKGIDSTNKKLYIYFSKSLMGPYTPHPCNPVINSLNACRPAGNLIEVDGAIYRPSQNCEKIYGESVTISKITILNESDYFEEPYMVIDMKKNSDTNHGMIGLHTINALDDIIIVDSMRWIFSPRNKVRNFLKYRGYW
jgi:hypothetical protein